MTPWTCAACGAENRPDGSVGFCATCGASPSASRRQPSGILAGVVLGFFVVFCEFVSTWTLSHETNCFAIVGPITGGIVAGSALVLYFGVREARRGRFTTSQVLTTAGFIALVPTAACAVQSFGRTRC